MTHRPKRSRQFSLAAVLILLAFFVIAAGMSVYILAAQFKVSGIIRVNYRGDVPINQNYDYRQAQSSVVELLRSDSVIRAAVREATKGNISVNEVRKRLDVQVMTGSEFISIWLRGREFRDDKIAFSAILDEILKQCITASTDQGIETTVVQPPVLH